MSEIRISPHALCGSLTPPVSKSDAHRAIICAALANGTSTVGPITDSADITATVRCLSALGARIERIGDSLRITGGQPVAAAVCDCGESGSTLRFLLPVAAALGVEGHFIGQGRLPARPIDVLLEQLALHGVTADREKLPLTLHGRLRSGTYTLPGDISSQYITGLLLALPLLQQPARIRLTTPLQSSGYVDMTIATLARFGVQIGVCADGYEIPAGCGYTPCDYRIEGDWSSAAFPIAAAAIGGDITLHGLDAASHQGDKAVIDLFQKMGADITHSGNAYRIRHGLLCGISVDASEIPDMVPALAAAAAFAKGETLIHSAGRLRIKESDRLTAVANALRAVGIRVEEGADYLRIHGGTPVGGRIDGVNDHRIVMAFSVLAAYASGETVITDGQAVAKSYPSFFDDFKKLGGICDVL